ncbi:predicted protein [Histoplasma capsulatum G186AR]|uniref:Uncharacterized protein n=1 Tax=Ajellomyces capsulatus (strain G186AR / H82 / ATCC MYA-2454 / RMSCC 2432) TaxID=447093 RepID=C0NT24_AJECG|nr:uncharacterized protein HCBG_06304 [Histoplasma capsulatum G186AR]EEH05185.1 predicted protein [Histoplasma capsulatum G186AR]
MGPAHFTRSLISVRHCACLACNCTQYDLFTSYGMSLSLAEAIRHAPPPPQSKAFGNYGPPPKEKNQWRCEKRESAEHSGYPTRIIHIPNCCWRSSISES